MDNIVYTWHSEKGGNTCDKCRKLDGRVFKCKEDVPPIPVHTNCKCEIEKQKIGEFEEERENARKYSLWKLDKMGAGFFQKNLQIISIKILKVNKYLVGK